MIEMEEMSCSRVNSNPRPSLSVLYRYNVKRCNNLNLVFAEVGFGLVIQPLYMSFLIKLLHENNSDCNTHNAFYFIGPFFPQLFPWALRF